jgi:hypothetical protein
MFLVVGVKNFFGSMYTKGYQCPLPVFRDINRYESFYFNAHQILLYLVEVGSRDKKLGEKVIAGLFVISLQIRVSLKLVRVLMMRFQVMMSLGFKDPEVVDTVGSCEDSVNPSSPLFISQPQTISCRDQSAG